MWRLNHFGHNWENLVDLRRDCLYSGLKKNSFTVNFRHKFLHLLQSLPRRTPRPRHSLLICSKVVSHLIVDNCRYIWHGTLISALIGQSDIMEGCDWWRRETGGVWQRIWLWQHQLSTQLSPDITNKLLRRENFTLCTCLHSFSNVILRNFQIDYNFAGKNTLILSSASCNLIININRYKQVYATNRHKTKI